MLRSPSSFWAEKTSRIVSISSSMADSLKPPDPGVAVGDSKEQFSTPISTDIAGDEGAFAFLEETGRGIDVRVSETSAVAAQQAGEHIRSAKELGQEVRF